MFKILIADDHAVVRRGLRQIINDEPDFEVIGEAQNGQEVLELIDRNNCDVVVLDITMPDKNGLAVLQEAKMTHPQLPVLILSMHPEDQFAVRALKLGASGYLTKESAPEELVGALRKVISGGKYISSTLADQLVAEIGSPLPRPMPDRLSEREFQVLKQIAQGRTIGQIAETMDLSVKTISTYRTRLLLKMKMKTNAELVRYAVNNGLVDFGG
ncbi:MAG TPA: response regulator transcription factor [Blastocatellia bacterium]|nr:response regulator transcription factor [Blastocatellia bacterium]HMV85681.1 response regulator transcription factor [Blastocatellia bacterium]HMX25542.1 response regulator transcription factor [Blastocatellia bacterium]HMZ20492.1 response regulator transcription factor [Blastocatellia bacterium]HNG33439.1 response regulator transcription factor [Blastocatellia bacterium]